MREAGDGSAREHFPRGVFGGDALYTRGVLKEHLGETCHQRLGDAAEDWRRQTAQGIEREEARVAQLVDLDDLGDQAQKRCDYALVEKSAERACRGDQTRQEVKCGRPSTERYFSKCLGFSSKKKKKGKTTYQSSAKAEPDRATTDVKTSSRKTADESYGSCTRDAVTLI